MSTIEPKRFQDLIGIVRPERPQLWGPIITMRNLVLLWAETGIGKTFFALKLAQLFAAGGTFLKWSCTTPRRVLYIDGEMGALDIRDRLLDINAGAENEFLSHNVSIASFEDFGACQLPNLGSIDGQAWYSEQVKPFEVIIIDNLLTAAYPEGRYENDFTVTQKINTWVVRQRNEGRTVIMIHHAGKSGDQLGSSTKRVGLDTEIKLEAAPRMGDWSRFILRFKKHRNFYGPDEEPLLVSFRAQGGKTDWKWEVTAEEESMFDAN
jgi:RecA-family ATPase